MVYDRVTRIVIHSGLWCCDYDRPAQGMPRVSAVLTRAPALSRSNILLTERHLPQAFVQPITAGQDKTATKDVVQLVSSPPQIPNGPALP